MASTSVSYYETGTKDTAYSSASIVCAVDRFISYIGLAMAIICCLLVAFAPQPVFAIAIPACASLICAARTLVRILTRSAGWAFPLFCWICTTFITACMAGLVIGIWG